MVERDDALVGVKDVPVYVCVKITDEKVQIGGLGGGRRDCLPFVPLYAWLCDKSGEGLRKGSTGDGDGEPSALLDRLSLGLKDVLCKRI